MDQTSLSAIWRFGQADPPSGTLLWILSGSEPEPGPDPEPPPTTLAFTALFADITNPNEPTYFNGPEYVYTAEWWNDETGDSGYESYNTGNGPLVEDCPVGSNVSMYLEDWENPIPLPSPSAEYMPWNGYHTSFTRPTGFERGYFYTQRIPTSITIAGTWDVHYTDQYDQPKTDTGVFNATLTKKR